MTYQEEIPACEGGEALTCCSEQLCPWPGWAGLGALWDSGGYFCSRQGVEFQGVFQLKLFYDSLILSC